MDTRPPEMARSTLHAHVQRCPACGYCAVEAANFDPRYREVMRGESYQKQLRAADCPELASTLICAGLLRESIGEHERAGWFFLKAAWVCDDHKRDDLARQWRSRAADHFIAALAQGESLGEQAGASETLVVDCLRRAGRFEKAVELLRYAEGGESDPLLRRILAFQRVLLQCRDTACHTVEEVPGLR